VLVTDFRALGLGAVLVLVGCGGGPAAIHDGGADGDGPAAWDGDGGMDGDPSDADATMIAFGSFVYHYQVRDSSWVVTVPAAGEIDVAYGGGVTHCGGAVDAAALASFVALSLAPATRQALADPAPCPGTSDLIVESMELQLAGGPTISKTMTERCTDGPIVELRAGVRTLTGCAIGFQDGSASP
jgi:hypothetical protein